MGKTNRRVRHRFGPIGHRAPARAILRRFRVHLYSMSRSMRLSSWHTQDTWLLTSCARGVDEESIVFLPISRPRSRLHSGASAKPAATGPIERQQRRPLSRVLKRRRAKEAHAKLRRRNAYEHLNDAVLIHQ